MGACARCQFDMPEAAAKCPRCGAARLPDLEVPDLELPLPPPQARPPARAASGPRPATPRAAPQALDLDLGPRGPSPTKATKPAGGAAKAQAGQGNGAGAAMGFDAPPPGLDVDDDDLGGPSLELAISPASAPSARMPSARPPPSRGDSGLGSVPPPSGRPQAARGRPASVPPPAAADGAGDLDPYDVRRAAGFGPTPEYPWESVVYAVRVLQRTQALRAQLPEAREAEKQQNAALDEALVAFLDGSRDELLRDGGIARALEPVRELQARYDERRRAFEQGEARAKAERAEVEREALACERAVQQGRSTRDGLSSEAARLYESQQAGDTMAGQMLEAVRGQMQEAEREANEAVGRITELRRQYRELERSHGAMMAELHEAMTEADKPRRFALVEVGRGLLDRRNAAELPGFAPVDEAHKRLRSVVHRRRLLEAALDSYDRKKVQEGALILLGVAVLLLGLVALGVARMNRELSAPPPLLPPM